MIATISEWFNVSTWDISGADIGVIVGYLVLMIIVGWICKGISSNVSDYVRMGCKSTWWLMGTSIFMMSTSADTLTGSAGMAYMSGWSFVLLSLSGFFGYVVMAAFFAPWMRRTRAITPADTVRMRYGNVVEQAFAYLGAVGGMFWGSVWLYALAKFMAVVFHIPVPTVIVFVGIVVMFYSVSGGSWSVQITDTLQAYVLVPICLVVLFLSLKSIGGFSGLFEGIQAQGLSDDYKVIMDVKHEYSNSEASVGAGYFSIGWILAHFAYSFIKSANMTACYRFLSTKSDADARKAAILAGGLLLAGSFVWYIPAMVGRIQYENQIVALAEGAPAAEGTASENTVKLGNVADGAYAVVAKNVLPPGLLGLVVIGLFAATMSSLDSSLTGNAGIVVNNIYPPLARLFGGEPWTGLKLLRLTKIINFLLGVWAISLALVLWRMAGEKSIFEIGMEIVGKLSTPMVAAMVLSFFVRTLPWWSPLVGMFCGFTASLIMPALGLMDGWMWHHRIFITMSFTLIPTLACSLFWRTASEEYRQRVDAFFRQIRTPVDFEKEVGESVDHTLMTMIGWLGLLMTAAISILAFFAQDAAGVWAVLFVVGCIGSMSLFMLLMGVHKTRKLEAGAAALAETEKLAADD